MKILNLDVLNHDILLHNVFPFVIAMAEAPGLDFMAGELSKEDEVLYFNFTTNEDYIPHADAVTPPADLVAALEQQLLQLVDSAEQFAEHRFDFVFELLMIFKRSNYQLLSSTVFCYKIIDVDADANYTVSSIFDYQKYFKLFAEQNGGEKEAFAKAFASTSLFSKFVEDGFDRFYRALVRGEALDRDADHVFRFLTNIVDSFGILPSADPNRETFFDGGAKPFSLLSVDKAESERFDAFSQRIKHRHVHMEDCCRFYIDRTRGGKSALIYSDRKATPHDQTLDISIAASTVRSHRSGKSCNVRIGKYYFKPVKVENLVNVSLKDLNESQIELKQMLDIFS